MSEDRTDATEAVEDGGGGDEKYEINSMGEPARTGKGCPAEKRRERC